MTKPTVLLVGKPNCGKSLLFNQLTGLRQKVSNFPGATVSINSGSAHGITYVDHPGIYSLDYITSDEKVSIDALRSSLSQEQVKLVVCVLDVTRLEASLSLGIQIKNLALAHHKRTIFALNMVDEINQDEPSQHFKALESALSCPVIPISARTAQGLEDLKHCIQTALETSPSGSRRTELPKDPQNVFAEASTIAKQFGPLASMLFKRQTRLDNFFLSSWFGALVFAGIMFMLFQAIFSWSEPLMTAIEWLVAKSGAWVVTYLPEGLLKDFTIEAIFNGLGAFLIFVPQIFMLTFIIGLLEDSGYLARAAIICHKPLSLFGLDGKSFVPYLSGHACAIPAILSSRTIDSPRRRMITMLTIPLTVCSARLPVYSLIIASVIPSRKYLGGILGLQGLVFFAMYAFGIFMALTAAGILSKIYGKKNLDAPFILELPPYRLPHWKPLIRKSMTSAYNFVKNAGGIILMATIVVWAFGYFPNGSGHLNESWLAMIGKYLEPIFMQIGLDWKFAVAILASFLAREVFVGTLGTLMGIEDTTHDFASLADRLSHGQISLASGIALLVFYGIALQCVSTVAVLNKETNRPSWGVVAIISYGLLAYATAWVAYHLVGVFS